MRVAPLRPGDGLSVHCIAYYWSPPWGDVGRYARQIESRGALTKPWISLSTRIRIDESAGFIQIERNVNVGGIGETRLVD